MENPHTARPSWLPSAFLLLLFMAFVLQASHARKIDFDGTNFFPGIKVDFDGRTFFPPHGRKEKSIHPEHCPSACNFRCSAAREHKACLTFCNQCCKKCLCVPPGTNGNKAVCPCYNKWKTKKGGPKCP